MELIKIKNMNNITRYCKLIQLINESNDYLENEKDIYCGTSFEDCYSNELNNLNNLREEFMTLNSTFEKRLENI